MASIQVKALGAIRRNDELLVYVVEPNDAGGTDYRLLGGTVEFGEHSRATLHREFHEELGVGLSGVRPVGTYEEIFEHDGAVHHEIWRVYGAGIVETWPYERERFTAYEPDLDLELTVMWKSIEDLTEGPDMLYGDAVLEDLAHSAQ